MSQRELAVRSGVPQTLICRLEAGKAGLFSTYAKLFEAMGCVLTPVSARPRDEIIAELVAMRLAAEDRRHKERQRRRFGSAP